MRYFLPLISIFILASCQSQNTEANETGPELPKGSFAATLDIQGEPLKFEFTLSDDPKVFILLNGEEKFEITDFTLTDDSLIVPLHIFDTQLKAKYEDSTFTGHWIKNYAEGYLISFSAEPLEMVKESSDELTSTQPVNLASRYRVYFESELEDSTVAVAEFRQDGAKLKGTFLTQTGDYRYLKGKVSGDLLRLTTFDGEHAFVFTGQVRTDGSIEGRFLSGKSWHETFMAYPDSIVELADASSLTYLKEGLSTLSFSGKDLQGKVFTNNDPSLEGKPYVLQIMGTWCPNCMDETAYLSDWHKNNKPENLEVVSLAFERKDNFNYARERLQVLKDEYDITYPLLFGGGYAKDEAAKKLPELNTVIAYPTLVFFSASHEVTHIHTGFMGPGTGEHFERWKLDFEKRISEIAN